jgi:hypothetical protein
MAGDCYIIHRRTVILGCLMGLIIHMLTFPGVVVHEMAHVHFCRRYGVRVHKACYFRFGKPPGYVVHDTPDTAYQSIMVSVGPFIVNTVVGVLLAVLSTFVWGRFVEWCLIWLSVSISMHAFPSTGDANNMWRAIWSRRGSMLTRLFGTPLVGIVYLGALGSFFWLDLLYGVAIGIGIRYLVASAPSLW